VFDLRKAFEDERDDLRAKYYLTLAELFVAVLPSAALFVLGFPRWVVWPFFVLAFVFVAIIWLTVRYYDLYLSRYPGTFWPQLPVPGSGKPPAPQVVQVTPELELALWNEWLDRARRSGRAGEVFAAILHIARPFVGHHIPRHPGVPDLRS
jgi:uncharacterized membrane protein YhdT